MLKVGLIGCGFMGAMHVNCYKNIEGVEITALADVRNEKAVALAEGTNAKLYGDGMELIANADVDIIDICLPTFLHAKYALAAMEKVKYLFLEKPVTLTTAEADELLKKSKECGCNVQIGQVIRFWDEYVVLRDMLAKGELGKVVNANFRRLSPRPDWGWEDWSTTFERSGGAGQDLHIHDIDFALSIFGEPKKLYSVQNLIGEKCSYVNTLMQYDDFVVGVEGTWDLPASHPFEATFRVVCEKGVVENAGGKFMLYTDKGAEEIKLEKKKIGSTNAGGNISDLGGYYNELLYFTAKAAAGEKIEDATIEDGVASLKFLLDKELSFGA
ncbi:MAG: Gfo/Idh/MocA family oxidoreductase [Clostridia bacterium]|nr:Gfo/Idh/MocA family oxidoreductase [Clostridia bacterium]